MKKIAFLIITVTIICSCKNSKKESSATNIVPYALMIESDLNILDSTPVAIMQYNLDTLGKTLDSSIITKIDFRKLTKVFTNPNIADKNLVDLYKEASYVDEFTKSYNFSYTPLKNDLPIRNVLVSTSLADNSKFKSVSITKYYKENGSEISEQLYWKTNAYCLISKSITTNNITTYNNKKIVWGM